MLVGHTKFSPDRHFGVFKKSFRVSSVSSLIEVKSVVERSSANVPQTIKDSNGDVLVPFYQWSAFLSQFFRSIPNITSYHNFKVSSGKCGTVLCSLYSDSTPQEFDILKPGVSGQTTSMPEKTIIPGLDNKRQWYLYENIRMHCKSTLAADLTCPKPELPKPTTNSTQPTTSTLILLISERENELVLYAKTQGTLKRLAQISDLCETVILTCFSCFSLVLYNFRSYRMYTGCYIWACISINDPYISLNCFTPYSVSNEVSKSVRNSIYQNIPKTPFSCGQSHI